MIKIYVYLTAISCHRDFKRFFIVYKTDKNQTVFIKSYNKKAILITAFIKVDKDFVAPVQSTKFIKRKISHIFDKNPDEMYVIKDCLQNENILSCGDYKSNTLNKSVKIPVTKLSENLLKFKKSQGLAEITIAECAKNKPIEINRVCSNNFDIKDIDLSYLPNGFGKEKFKNILIDYYDRIRDKNVSGSIIPYEHTLQLYDNTPVTSKPWTVPYIYQSENFKQLDELLEKAIIEHSDSPYSSPITPVKTLDLTICLCCNFRKLKAKTIPKSFPLPKADNVLDDMAEAMLLSSRFKECILAHSNY